MRFSMMLLSVLLFIHSAPAAFFSQELNVNMLHDYHLRKSLT